MKYTLKIKKKNRTKTAVTPYQMARSHVHSRVRVNVIAISIAANMATRSNAIKNANPKDFLFLLLKSQLSSLYFSLWRANSLLRIIQFFLFYNTIIVVNASIWTFVHLKRTIKIKKGTLMWLKKSNALLLIFHLSLPMC